MMLFLFVVMHDSRFFPERFVVVVVENLLLCVFEKAKDHSVLKEMRRLCACLDFSFSARA